MKILLVNGPNLNLLGVREPEKYGNVTLAMVEEKLQVEAIKNDIELLTFQSNHEGELLDFIHKNASNAIGLIFNPGAFTHTSIALRDAILGVKIPFIEVHVTNVYKREAFRHKSFFKDISIGQIVGLGVKGYFLALEAFIDIIKKER